MGWGEQNSFGPINFSGWGKFVQGRVGLGGSSKTRIFAISKTQVSCSTI